MTNQSADLSGLRILKMGIFIPMFYSAFKHGKYEGICKNLYVSNEDLYLPIEVDTEFQDRHFPFLSDDRLKLTISVQLKAANVDLAVEEKQKSKGIFFRHWDLCKEEHKHLFKPYPTLKHDFCVFDFLEAEGYPVVQIKDPLSPISDYSEYFEKNSNIPPESVQNLYIDFYAYHMVSDITRLFKLYTHAI